MQEGHDLFMSVIGRTGEPRVSFALIPEGSQGGFRSYDSDTTHIEPLRHANREEVLALSRVRENRLMLRVEKTNREIIGSEIRSILCVE